MSESDIFHIPVICPITAQNAGLFISRGKGPHPTRVIDSHEIIFIKHGLLEIWEESQTFQVKAGQTLHLWPGRQHGGLSPMDADLKFYWIHFQLETNFNTSSATGEHTALLDIPQVVNITYPEKLESLFRYFLDEQESGRLNPLSANLLVTLMLVEITRPQPNTTEAADNVNAIATRAYTYIRLNYDQPLSAAKIALALGYNPDYLGRIYHKVYGCTLTEAIHRRRIKRACSHLIDSEMTVEQIALCCGFSDPDYFRRIFRRYMQTSPTEYRDLFTRVHVNTQ